MDYNTFVTIEEWDGSGQPDVMVPCFQYDKLNHTLMDAMERHRGKLVIDGVGPWRVMLPAVVANLALQRHNSKVHLPKLFQIKKYSSEPIVFGKITFHLDTDWSSYCRSINQEVIENQFTRPQSGGMTTVSLRTSRESKLIFDANQQDQQIPNSTLSIHVYPFYPGDGPLHLFALIKNDASFEADQNVALEWDNSVENSLLDAVRDSSDILENRSFQLRHFDTPGPKLKSTPYVGSKPTPLYDEAPSPPLRPSLTGDSGATLRYDDVSQISSEENQSLSFDKLPQTNSASNLANTSSRRVTRL